MQRLRTSGSSIIGYLSVPQLRRKVLNSLSAVQDTYYSTKDIFENHKVVFTIGTSLASIATAWGGDLTFLGEWRVRGSLMKPMVGWKCFHFRRVHGKNGYTLRHLHDSRVDQRLDSIEKAMKNNYHLENSDFKKLVGSGSSSAAAYAATAGTSLIIGYGFGWRGGKWYANRKFRKEQMKLLGQIKPKRWQLKFLRRPLTRPRLGGSAVTVSEGLQKDVPGAHNS